MLTQVNDSCNGFAPSPVVDAPYAMRPEDGPPGKPTRNSDLRHAQSVGRRRKAAPPTAAHRAKCVQRFIQKSMAEGRPIDLAPHGLDDTTWSELVALLSNEELAVVNAASGQSEPDDDDDDEAPISYDITQDDEPAPAPKGEMHGWRDQLAPLTDMFEWTDSDGHAHHLTIRADDLDSLLIQLRTVKAFISAAKARAQQKAVGNATTTEPQAAAEQAEFACPDHGTSRLRPSKFGGVYCATQLPSGKFCSFKSGKETP